MRKVIIMLVALLLVAPLYAADGDIQFDIRDNGNSTCIISYTVGSGLTTPVGVALNVVGTVATDPNITAYSNVDSFFDVYIDAAFDIGDTYTVGSGTPIANQTAAGQVALPASVICVSLAGLDDTGSESAGDGTVDLITLAAAPGTTVTISLNAVRGGAVSESGAMNASIGTASCSVTIPACWDACQLLGECSGDLYVDGLDVAPLIASFNKARGQAGFNDCCDFNRDGYVDGLDVAPLIANFNTSCP